MAHKVAGLVQNFWRDSCRPSVMEVGTQFDTFQQFKDTLDNLRLTGYHPLRVYKSQSGEDYKKRQDKKICTDVVDTTKNKLHVL